MEWALKMTNKHEKVFVFGVPLALGRITHWFLLLFDMNDAIERRIQTTKKELFFYRSNYVCECTFVFQIGAHTAHTHTHTAHIHTHTLSNRTFGEKSQKKQRIIRIAKATNEKTDGILDNIKNNFRSSFFCCCCAAGAASASAPAASRPAWWMLAWARSWLCRCWDADAACALSSS